MAIMMKRQLNDEEKTIILKRFGRCCYATGHEIPDNDEIHFDHIKSYVSGGPTELDNIAPMCKHHNLAKGQLPLEDFRIKLRIEDFFTEGNRLTLSDLLKYFKENGDIETYGENVKLTEINSGRIKLENHLFSQEFELQKCPLTNWKYFYCILPISILDSDDDDDNDISVDHVGKCQSDKQHDTGGSLHCSADGGPVADICCADVQNVNSLELSANNIPVVPENIHPYEGTSKTVSDSCQHTGKFAYWIIFLVLFVKTLLLTLYSLSIM